MTVKTNSKAIREKKAAREGKSPKPNSRAINDTIADHGKPLTVTMGELANIKVPKQIPIPGTEPKVHKRVEEKGAAFQDALARKKVADSRLEEAHAALLSAMSTHKVKTYRYQDVELVVSPGKDRIHVRELDNGRNV